MALKAFDLERFEKDEHGTWWYLAGQKKRIRLRATEQTCPRCGEQFLSAYKDVVHCSHSCAMLTYWEKRTPALKRSGTVPSHIKVKSPKKYSQDASGQWWYESGKYRLKTEVAKCARCECEFLAPHNRANRQTLYCSRKCAVYAQYDAMDPNDRRYEKARAWRGGRQTRKGGYIFVIAPPNHPSIQGTTQRYMPEHRLVMEKVLGRYLLRHERVHHKNGITNDNRPENLELWAHGHPSGQRVTEQQTKHCPTCTCHLRKDS